MVIIGHLQGFCLCCLVGCVDHISHQADVSGSKHQTALDPGQHPQAVECILHVANAFVACVDVSVQVHLQVCSHSGGKGADMESPSLGSACTSASVSCCHPCLCLLRYLCTLF